MAETDGPPGKNVYDERLAALKAHQQAVESAPEPEQQSLMKALLPLVLAQGADMLSTEIMLRSGGHETNPLPGMEHTAGRIGWGALETALLSLLAAKGVPAVRDKIAPAIHGTLAGQNMTIGRGPGTVDDRLGMFVRESLAGK